MYTDSMSSFDPITQDNLPTIFPPARFADIGSVVSIAIPLMFSVVGVILLGMLFMGAFKVITAGGNPENIQSAKQLFTYAVLGFVIILLSFLFVRVLGFMFNIEVLI